MYSPAYFRMYLKRSDNFVYMYKEFFFFKFCEKIKKKGTHLK